VSAYLADLLNAIRSAPNLERGLCIGQWDLFDQTDDPGITDLAQSLCAQCPVLARCRSWAATLDNRQLSGVVAGVVRPWEPGSRRKEAS
jgi:Transcription factor WhiB